MPYIAPLVLLAVLKPKDSRGCVRWILDGFGVFLTVFIGLRDGLFIADSLLIQSIGYVEVGAIAAIL